jgi:hypothetical protein
MTILLEDDAGVSKVAHKKRISGAKALISPGNCGTAEAVHFLESRPAVSKALQ